MICGVIHTDQKHHCQLDVGHVGPHIFSNAYNDPEEKTRLLIWQDLPMGQAQTVPNCLYDNYCFDCSTPFCTDLSGWEHRGHVLLRMPNTIPDSVVTVAELPPLGVHVTETIQASDRMR